MSIDPQRNRDLRVRRQRALRNGAAFLAVAVLVGALLLLVDFGKERPDLYEPARAPLTEATMILSETYGEEKELMDKLQMVHSRLENAIALLGKAERLDPEDKRQIKLLQDRLRALENKGEVRLIDPQALQRTYRDLTDRMNGLAHKLADPGS